MKALVDLILAITFLQLLPACGESSPNEPPDRELEGDGGASGAPGDESSDTAAGGGGMGGETSAVEQADDCETDADCDDGLACNGRERCQQGTCARMAPIDCLRGTTCVEDGSPGGVCEYVDAGSWVVFLSDAETPALFEPYAIRERLIGREEPIKLKLPLEPGDWARYVASGDWSFDNQYILFRPGPALLQNPDALYVVPMGNKLPGEPIELVTGANSAWGDWSPRRHQLLLSVDGGHDLVTLTDGQVKHSSFLGYTSFRRVEWSPDGSRLAILYARDSAPSTFIAGIVDVPESGEVINVRNFAQGGRELHELLWSPDGKWLALIEMPSDGGDDVVSLVDADSLSTSQPINLHTQAGTELSGRLWSPDGRFFAYSERRKSDSLYDVWIYDTLHPELGSVLVAGDLYYTYLRDWLPTSTRLLIGVNERKGDADETWFLEPGVPYDHVEHQSIRDLKQVAWVSADVGVYSELLTDSIKLYLGSISGGYYLGGRQTVVDSVAPDESLWFSTVVEIAGAPGALLYLKNGELRSVDIRNDPPGRESSLIATSDGYPSAPGDGGAFFSIPDDEGYDDLYWVDLRGRSPGEPLQVNGEGSVFAYTVAPMRREAVHQ
jgi:hypothetical protein